jgi:16S rRNA (cytosine1402-N4)-methyltransferase
LDDASRGFTYRVDAPLDMRMNQEDPLTAADIVNTYEEQELYRIIRDYGEEHFAKSIARKIVQERQKHSIDTTGQLVDIIRASMPVKAQVAAGHPAKRTFQALRIACNRELEVLEHSIDTMIDHLKPGGRLSIITFHSLEDRIVKNAFKNNENPCTCPPNFPVCVCGKTSKGHAVYRKPVLPSEEEMETNPRAKSAKLRSFEHI